MIMESGCGPLEQQTVAAAVSIRRKRTADSQEELAVSSKRSCQNGAERRDATTSFYSLVGTTNPPGVSGITGLPSSTKVIDFEPAKASGEMDVQMTANHNAVSNAQEDLSDFHDDVDQDDAEQKRTSKESYQVIVNGVQAYHTFDSYRDTTAMSCSPEDDEILLADQCHIKVRVDYDTDSDADSDDEDSGEESNGSDQYLYHEDIEDWNDEDSIDSDDLAMRLSECEFGG
uniref:RNA polymerase II nuclear localization protein SLC7A6OS n=1 Tax=Ascaris lumbricoides TaxID=6252 RepID=A0A0M3HF97_ASCLU